jgi:haloalkane dehalogenase
VFSAKPYARKKFVNIRGLRMAYIDEGQGDAIVFQHGNPTSSYLWRNVMPHLDGLGRLIAVDLAGMGDSGKLADSGPERYSYHEQRDYLFSLWDHLEIGDDVVFVVHDWGSALGFDWACQHRERVAGIAYLESIVAPLNWSSWPARSRDVFRGFRSSAGESMVLDHNVFVERMLPGGIQRVLSDEEMSVYREPYRDPGESRRPTLSWPRQIPIDGEPAKVAEVVANYSSWLASSDLPKLFINGEPGALLTGEFRDWCRTWPNQREVTVPGLHFLQEDSPDEIGRAIADFVRRLRGSSSAGNR